MDNQLRLQQWMQYFGLSQGQLGERAGVPQPTIHRIVSGETSSPRTGTMRKIIAALGLSTEQFERGPTEQTVFSTAEQILLQVPIIERIEDARLQYRPEKYPISQHFCAGLGLDAAQILGAIALHRSMEPTIYKGDVVLIDASSTQLVAGEIFALQMDGVVMIRRVLLSESLIILAPDNPDRSQYFDIQLPRQANVHVIGRVFWRGGLLK